MANKNDLVKPSESSQAQGVEGNQWKSRETKRDQVKQDRTNRVRGTPSEYVDHLSTHVSLSPPLSGSCLGGHDIHCRSSPMMTRALWLAFGEAYLWDVTRSAQYWQVLHTCAMLVEASASICATGYNQDLRRESIRFLQNSIDFYRFSSILIDF